MLKYNILSFGLFLLLAFLLNGCSGCSKSGLQKKIEEKKSAYQAMEDEQKNQTNNTTVQPNSPGAQKNKDHDYSPSNKENNSSTPTHSDLSSLFKQLKSTVFIIIARDDEHVFQGSGFFISESGVAVSNYHVLENTFIGNETIHTEDGQTLKIERVYEKNKENDFIIFQVNTKDNVPFIPVSHASPEIGASVFAIGNPRGLEHTLSSGIISGYRANENLIQTTTEITHGSSGGPLLNMNGEVVGITTSGLGEANLNFAINIKILQLNRYINLK